MQASERKEPIHRHGWVCLLYWKSVHINSVHAWMFKNLKMYLPINSNNLVTQHKILKKNCNV